jgi:methylglutaconyl-CoA hydratase
MKMPNYKLIKVEEKNNGIYWVTLNRPELHNAFNEQMIEELTNAFHNFSLKNGQRLVVLTGEGPSFCAGADLHWMKKMKDYSYEDNLKDSQNLALMFQTIDQCSVPILGRINGHALGGGAGLLSVCDYNICVESAKIGFTEVKLGLLPAVISPFVLKKIGESFGRAYFLTGEKFNPATALRMQLIHKVVISEQLDLEVEDRLQEFLSAAPEASHLAKKLIKEVLGNVTTEVQKRTCEMISKKRISPEAQEGMIALLEKRKPHW